MKKENYVPILIILGIANAELAMYFGDVLPGLGIHIVNLLAIIFIIIFSDLDIKVKNVLQSLTLLILLRIINLSVPQFFTDITLQYPLIYGIMFIPIYYIIRDQQISAKELGVNFNKFYIYLPFAILIGLILAIIEYKIMNPIALIRDTRLSNIILLIIIMFVFIGIVEEIIFRSILQTRLEKTIGNKYAILLTGGIFGIMHSSFGIINEVIFAVVIGIFLGYIFQQMRNLPFIVSIHGSANVILFGILPFILR